MTLRGLCYATTKAITQTSKTLTYEYPFLKYASVHWPSHTKSLRKGESKAWTILHLVVSGNLHFAKLPWKSDPQNQNNALQWAKDNRHYAIIQTFGSDEMAESMKWAAYNEEPLLFGLLYEEMSVANYEGRDDILVCATSLGHLKAVRDIHSFGWIAPANSTPEADAMIAAASRGHVHVISEIVSWGIDPDTQNASGISALESAAQGGHVRAIEKLLSYRPKVEFGDALPVAASGGFLCIVDRLVKAGADIDGRLNYGTALAEAASAGHIRTVNALLRAGADVNGVARMESPLTRAVQGGHLTVVDILLAARADPNAYMASCNEYPLIRATLLGRLDIVNSLLSAGADDVAKKIPAFFQTERSKTNNVEIYRRLLEHEVKLSKRPARSRTMLHAASELGRLADVRTLLGTGIKADTVDEVGRTALHIAASTTYVEVVSELCQAGSNIVHATDRFGNTALHIAARDSRCGETLRVLSHTKIDKYAENLSGFTAMDSIPLSRGDKIDILTKAGY